MTTMGTLQRYDDFSQDADIRALRWRYDNWTLPEILGLEFDLSVYRLIKATLTEAEGK